MCTYVVDEVRAFDGSTDINLASGLAGIFMVLDVSRRVRGHFAVLSVATLSLLDPRILVAAAASVAVAADHGT